MNEDTDRIITEDCDRLSKQPDQVFLDELIFLRANDAIGRHTNSKWVSFVKNELETRLGIQKLHAIICP